MCGIAGMVNLGGRPISSTDQQRVQEMTRAIEHRGPDHTDFGSVGAALFGFQRLSLLALENGNQPFISSDRKVMLMVNGEVYNHRQLRTELSKQFRFETESDCEVILHGYLREGLAFLQRVNGMFAFTLYDARNMTLVLGRDRFGIKPLSYHRDGERVIFASEAKALFADPRTPRKVDWRNSLADPGLSLAPLFVTDEPTSWFEDIEIVPAAHYVEIDVTTGSMSTRRYWDAHSGPDLSGCSSDEIVQLYREALENSVRDCLTADIEVGLFLSGGIDSAAVAAFSQGTGIHTFTALTGSTLVNGDAEYSHRTARACGLENHQVLFDRDRVPTLEEWKTIVWTLESPQASPEHFYKFELHRYARLTRPGLKAMMLGQASDEFNGGYSKKMSGGEGYEAFLASLDQMELSTALNAAPGLSPWFDPEHGSLIRRDRLPTVTGDAYRHFVDWKLHDIEQYNNWHEDRTAAANSIEARVPFLDHRLVEITNAVPREMHEELFWDKTILRRALQGVLPPDILQRPKVSFFYDDPGYNNQRTFATLMTRDNFQIVRYALSAEGAEHWVDKEAMFEAVQRLDRNPGDPSMEYVLGVLNLGILENMIASMPRTLDRRDMGEAPVELHVQDWDKAEEELRQRLLEEPLLNAETRVFLKDGVQVLRPVMDDHSVEMVAIDGVLSFVLDGEDRGLWLDLLRALGEPHSLKELTEILGQPYSVVYEYVGQGLEADVLDTES